MEEAKKTISLSFELDPDYAAYFTLIPAPATKIFETALTDPAFGGDYFRGYALHPIPNLVLKVWPTIMTEKQMLDLVRHAYFKFYFRPSFIMRSISQLNGFKDIFAKTGMALKIITTK